MIDNSQIAEYQRCPHKYYLRYKLGLERKKRDIRDVDLEWGTKAHKFVEKYLKKENTNEVWDSFENVGGESAKTKESGIFLCNKYIERYDSHDSQFKVLGAEITDKVKVGNSDYYIKLDGVLSFNEKVFALENKTTKNIYPSYFDRYFIDSQMTGYYYYCLKKYGRCDGVILNVLAISHQDKPTLLEVEDPLQKYYSNVEVKFSNYYKYRRDMAYCNGYKAKFERETIDRSPIELKMWEEETKLWIKNIENETCYPRALGGGACSMFRGCSYRELCKVADDEQIMEALYSTLDNPFEYLGVNNEN